MFIKKIKMDEDSEEHDSRFYESLAIVLLRMERHRFLTTDSLDKGRFLEEVAYLKQEGLIACPPKRADLYGLTEKGRSFVVELSEHIRLAFEMGLEPCSGEPDDE